MNATDYEIFIQKLLQQMLEDGPLKKIHIDRLKKFKGRSGVFHEIDLSYEFIIVGVKYLTLVECKHWNSYVGKNIVQSFHSNIQDIGAHKGIIVSLKGFQKGAIEYAQSYGIGLYKASDDGSLDQYSFFDGPVPFTLLYLEKNTDAISIPGIVTGRGVITPTTDIFEYISQEFGLELALLAAQDYFRAIGEPDKVQISSLQKGKALQQVKALPLNWEEKYKQLNTGLFPVYLDDGNLIRWISVFIYGLQSGNDNTSIQELFT